MEFISFFDISFALILSLIFIARAREKQNVLLEENTTYKFYANGLIAKFVGAFSFCCIYLFYYKGGDTLNYFQGAKSFYNLFFKSPADYFHLMTNGYEVGITYHLFDLDTGRPRLYMLRDSRTMLVLKLTSILTFPALGGFFTTTLLIAKLSYSWIWKGFLLVANRYPEIRKQIAISFLFLPSVIFWGSGIMKDTYTLAASCYCLYLIDAIFITKENRFKNFVQLLLATYLIISIKSYLLFALLPGALIFINFERVQKIKNTFIKILVFPLSLAITIVIAQAFFLQFENEFGKYAADKILDQAALQQQDLKRAVYGKNSFDIGDYEPTIRGVASKAPEAINAAIFRPYLWEVGSPTMLLSAIENAIITVLIFYFLTKVGPKQFIKFIFKDAYLLFCLIFTVSLALGIGLSAANFGALVRYKIPFMPYLVSLFYVMNWHIKNKEKEIMAQGPARTI